MTPEELRVLVLTAGLECRLQRKSDGDEVVLQVCTFCGNERWNLGLSPSKGFYHCWTCKAGGRLDAFLRQMTGQSFNIPTAQRGERRTKTAPPPPTVFKLASFAEVPSAAHYLTTRGLPPDVAAEYGMGVCVEPNHQLYGRIVIPARDFWSGEIRGWVGRSYTGKHPKYLSTLGQSVVTGWSTRGARTPCVLVEGHLDGVAVHRAGFAVGVLGGTAAGDVDLFVARLVSRPIVILLDGDAQAQAMALAWRLMTLHPDVRVQPLAPDQDPGGIPLEVLQDLLSRSAA